MAHRCSRGSPNLKQDSNGVASVGQLWRPAAAETETSRRPWADLSLLKVGGSRGADEQRRWTAQRRGERREGEGPTWKRRGRRSRRDAKKRRLDYTHATRELLQAAARRRTTEETPDEGGRDANEIGEVLFLEQVQNHENGWFPNNSRRIAIAVSRTTPDH